MTRMLPAAILLSAVLAIAGAEAGGSAMLLHYVFKPLTTILIFARAVQLTPAIGPRYRLAVLIGVIFSLSGDIFLMLPETQFKLGFILGLASFLVAHVLFLVALTADTRLFAKPLILLGFAALGAVNLFVLWPGLTADLRVPVLVYVACLIAMTSQAVIRYLSQHTHASKLAALGGMIFLLSDTLIAYNRFYVPLPFATTWILCTYYLAMFWISGSIRSEAHR